MSKYRQQEDVKLRRSMRAWSTGKLKSYLYECRRDEPAPDMHKEMRRILKQKQRCAEEELARRLGAGWEEREQPAAPPATTDP